MLTFYYKFPYLYPLLKLNRIFPLKVNFINDQDLMQLIIHLIFYLFHFMYFNKYDGNIILPLKLDLQISKIN